MQVFGWSGRAPKLLACAACLGVTYGFCEAAAGQTDAWTKPASGSWEEPYWSLGAPPLAGQSVAITNAGWKAVAIGAATAASFPQSLNLLSLEVASPPDSYNVLLLNYAGYQAPLSVAYGQVASNAAIRMLASCLYLSGGEGEGLSIGGEFDQEENSIVSGQQVDIGYIGPGTYNLQSGTLALNHIWVGGAFQGVFNQTGGTNNSGTVHIDGGGVYNLEGGDFNPKVSFETDLSGQSFFHQVSGNLNQGLSIFRGAYWQEGGINAGGIVAPISDGASPFDGAASVLQTGGTNLGSLDIGSSGSGTYTLSNGVSFSPSVTVGPFGSYTQWGGDEITAGTFTSVEMQYAANSWAHGIIGLHGGSLSSGSMNLSGAYLQTGGTNVVDGTIAVNTSISYAIRFDLEGGMLTARSMSTARGFSISGGLCVLTNSLTVYGIQNSDAVAPYGPDLNVAGGRLIVPNLTLLHANAAFASGTLEQSGALTMSSARILPGSGTHQLGQLALGVSGSSTTSWIEFPQTGGCILRFADSSGLPWTNSAALWITNWAGDPSGGGAQQIVFGSSASGLTPSQLSQIWFANPAGLGEGIFPARILPNGEIVPGNASNSIPQSPTLRLVTRRSGGPVLSLTGHAGGNYSIQVSTNMIDWVFWTNQIATNGTLAFSDDSAPVPRKFYRAVLNP
ncbi:MAG TPA: hypothetical protein VHH88_09750 [Verrucomicrobiae bacterium]|nr:hypothetical protein [Verrucomicrobiae bacterium]